MQFPRAQPSCSGDHCVQEDAFGDKCNLQTISEFSHLDLCTPYSGRFPAGAPSHCLETESR